ncbi:hypothetical protein ABK040_009797 [Willaertia magna]
MSFNLRFCNPTLFSKVIDLLVHFTDIVQFKVSKEGLTIHAMDTSQVMLFELKLIARKALTFVGNKPTREMIFGVNLKLLNQATKDLKQNDELGITFKEDRITLTILKFCPKRELTYNIALFDINSDEYAIEHYDNNVEAELLFKTSTLSDLISELKGIGEKIRFSINNQNDIPSLIVEGSNECISAKVEVHHDENHLTISMRNSGDGLVGNVFSAKILGAIVKTGKISESVLVQLSTDAPLSVIYLLEDCVGSFRYYIAPFLEDNESDDE